MRSVVEVGGLAVVLVFLGPLVLCPMSFTHSACRNGMSLAGLAVEEKRLKKIDESRKEGTKRRIYSIVYIPRST